MFIDFYHRFIFTHIELFERPHTLPFHIAGVLDGGHIRQLGQFGSALRRKSFFITTRACIHICTSRGVSRNLTCPAVRQGSGCTLAEPWATFLLALL